MAGVPSPARAALPHLLSHPAVFPRFVGMLVAPHPGDGRKLRMVVVHARPCKIRRRIGGIHRAKLGTFCDCEKLTGGDSSICDGDGIQGRRGGWS